MTTDNGTTDNKSTQQYLTFTLADEEYGVDILKVQEIKGFVPTTRVPNSPPDVVGVLNLRGSIVPLIDLRYKFNLPTVTYDNFNAIVVVVVRKQVVGVIVDSVSEVAQIAAEDIQPAPDLGDAQAAAMLLGIAQKGDQLITLLDIEAVLSERIGTSMAMAA
jgi:purine-binding chemotaxis protein CheW